MSGSKRLLDTHDLAEMTGAYTKCREITLTNIAGYKHGAYTVIEKKRKTEIQVAFGGQSIQVFLMMHRRSRRSLPHSIPVGFFCHLSLSLSLILYVPRSFMYYTSAGQSKWPTSLKCRRRRPKTKESAKRKKTPSQLTKNTTRDGSTQTRVV